jgi:hypothetical protein
MQPNWLNASGPGPPPEPPPVQLTVRIDLIEERRGGCSVRFGIPDDSALLAKHGSRGRALAACRDILVGELDTLVDEFADEE